MGKHVVVKDYNIEILKINNHVHNFKKLVMDFYGVFTCQI
jgi:hypothetical protein